MLPETARAPSGRNKPQAWTFPAEPEATQMQTIIWDHPVRLGVAGERSINGPQDALQYLNEMPQGGWFFERARNRCREALERGEALGLSRKAFIGAAIESSFPMLDDDIQA